MWHLFLYFILLAGCTSSSISLSPNADRQTQNRELARILGSSLQSLVILDEDVPRFLDALEDSSSPRLRQVAIRLLSLKPRPDIYQAISQKLTDPDPDVRKEALYALLRANSAYGEILFEAAVRPGVYQSERQALAGRISQFGTHGELLLIRMLAEADLNTARIAARNLKRLYPNYPNKPLQELILQDTKKSTFSASAWLASYPDENAVQQQLLDAISPYKEIRDRAKSLYQDAGDWVLLVTKNLLKKNVLTQPTLRILMIQKLIDRNDQEALNYLLEFFSYKTDAKAEQQTSQFLTSYRTLALPILREGFLSSNPVIREKSLFFVQDILDKKTALAAINLLNDPNKSIHTLAKKYIEKSVTKFAQDFAFEFNPQKNSLSDRTLFEILMAEGVPELLWYPSEKKIDPLRLFYTFQNSSGEIFKKYLRKINDSVYTLELRLIYELYLLGKNYSISMKTYRRYPIIQKTEEVAEIGLRQESNSSTSEENLLIAVLRAWYKEVKITDQDDIATLIQYRNQTTKIYENYLGLQAEYRETAAAILRKLGLDPEYMRAVATYIPKV